MSDGMNRRRFLKVLGVAGGGTAALSGCSTDRVEKLVPYLVPPQDQVPGVATWYASTCGECEAGCGLHVRVREGRAVKVEGNPDHPVNRGKLCSRGQASLQGLYNPDRVRGPMARTADGWEAISWDDAIARVVSELGSVDPSRVWFLSGSETGSFGRMIDAWLAAAGANPRVVYEPFAYEALRHANRTIFGIDAIPHFDFANAHVVVSFGTDFLETWLSPVQHARDFADGHAFHEGRMGKFIHVEPRMSMTGMNADEWVAPIPGTEALIALAMTNAIVDGQLATVPSDISRVRGLIDAHTPDAVADRCGVDAETIRRLAREFAAEASLAVAGGVAAQHSQAHITAQAVNLLNYVAGNIGRTVRFDADQARGASRYQEVARLASAMGSGQVGVLFTHAANPVFASPAASGFTDAYQQVGFKVSFARFMDETAALSDLILPDHDPLEQWNDVEPRTGHHALQQPVMRPVFDTRQTGDVLIRVAQQMGGGMASVTQAATFKDHLQGEWRTLQQRLGDRRDFTAFWNASLQAGGVWADAPAQQVRLATGASSFTDVPVWNAATGENFTLIAFPSLAIHDGRGANRPWLQELPDPVSKITWGTWVEMHPETAAEHEIHDGDILEVTTPNGTVSAPAFLYPGVRPDTIAMPLGQGHTSFGRYAEGTGANVYSLLSGEIAGFGGLSFYATATVVKTRGHQMLATNAGRSRQMGRGIAQAVLLGELTGEVEHEEEHADHAAPVPEHIEEVLDAWQESQYEEMEQGDYAADNPRWAMAIDLSRCTGCSACVTACHSENNIPIVGPELMRRGREMSWIRIERYFEGGEHGEPLETRVLPMTCQQCTNAPCEPVCPVYAAYHTPDGLNGQIYNRCVGTRYCGNNCPYKVRYFNWFDFAKEGEPFHAFPEPLNWQLNPDITVRTKGVMEKCTFCVQRIRAKQDQAVLADRELEDGEIMTACQQTCPSHAIVFGDLNDPTSRVSQLSQEERGYHVLEGLNTRPAITYLKKVRNVAEA